ncbi:fungal-specific transcription factor domain-containing protein [Phaeosphaeriaceae sp. PMI808]|nr:fungal-specific transcription factor domain-containing protein [Phaeosphaeriaceae sp. PMI808]
MAETAIIVSSPSCSTLSRAESAPTNPTNPRKITPPPTSPAKHAPKTAQTTGVTKRKQSKSRNGCITCKNKRLKCDETKPTCQQCARRAVICGGYKKDFKWRPFEEPSIPSKHQNHNQNHNQNQIQIQIHDPVGFHSAQHYAFTEPPQNTFYPSPSLYHATLQTLPLQTSHSQPPPFSQTSFPPTSNAFAVPLSSPYMMTPQSISPVDSFASASLAEPQSTFGAEGTRTRQDRAPSSVSSGQSPRLLDLLLPGTDLNVPPEEYPSFVSQHEAFYQPTGLTPPAEPIDDDVEEISRCSNLNSEAWVMRLPSPTPSSSSSSSSDSPGLPMLVQPQFSLASPENLTRRYDRDTCGVLSVKDGPTENPWRTLVWPLARDCPALYHAIASMTSFHQSKDTPALRIQGIDHMRSSVHALAAGLENMRFDAAISTTLVLAFSESWDQHIRTGINHIKGAKILINQALMQHRQTPKLGEEWARLKFLCNTWIYMDVIARLTSADEDENNDVDIVHESIYANGETDANVDPLMGCAHALFPIIGRVANLVRKVRRTKSNGPSIISQAIQLKSQLEEWAPPSFIEDPEDETTSPHDSIKAATAYQYATLLYLHQAVPEIPSQPSSVLAKRVLCELATVEPRSRSIIVHIYPLMAAGCEVMDQEDRNWVVDRWELMQSRMKLGILEKTLDVTKEVWCRRDAYAAECEMLDDMRCDSFSPNTPLKRDLNTFFEDFQPESDFCWVDTGSKRRAIDPLSYTVAIPSPVVVDPLTRGQTSSGNTEPLEHEFTVKGRLHWLGVMKDWSWEGMLYLLLYSRYLTNDNSASWVRQPHYNSCNTKRLRLWYALHSITTNCINSAFPTIFNTSASIIVAD